ncbi:MAG TPA: Ig-like domain repeat protein [Pirellulales bacterium]|nr:Ig-like domain repeat protein [Pirellulales bacterium]
MEALELRLSLAADTWTGAVDANWSTNNSGTTNWSNGVPASGDSPVFPGGAAHLTNIDDITGLTVDSITFSGASGGYNLGGSNPLTLSSGVTASNTAGANTINLPLVLGASQSFTVGTGVLLGVGGVVSGSAALTKAGDGTLDLLASDTYNGGTTVNAGTLLVDGSTGDVSLTAGTVGGTGTVGAITATGGSLAPGGENNPGVLNAAAVTLNSSTTFSALLDGTSAGNGPGKYSQLTATGTVDLGGATLSATLGFALPTNASFTLIQSTSAISGTFAQGTSLTIGGQKFQIVYNTNSVVLVAANTSTTLTPSANPAAVNQPVTFTATVGPAPGASGTPTGTVNFYDGATLLGSASLSTVGSAQQATFTTSTLAVGTHSIKAVYQGDASFNGSTSATVSEQVSTVSTTTTLLAPLNAISFGQSITLTVVVQAPGGVGTPTGTVTFFDGAASIGSASLATINGQQQASITTTSLAFGNRSLTAVYPGNATFAGSTSSTVIELVGNTNQRYVNQVYLDLLGRDVEPQGLVFWSAALLTGTSPFMMTQAIVASAEYHTREIQSIFQQYLGRPADAASLSAFGQFLSQGGTIAQTKAVVLGSNEYYVRHGNTPTGFANAIYEDLLGRPVDSAAQTAILAQLAAGALRSQIASQVMSHGEYQQRLVQTWYQQFLERTAEPGGLNYAVGRLAAGISEELVIAAIISSPEYFDRLGP